MQKWANRAAQRLVDLSDPVQQAYFQRIFTPIEDPEYHEHVEKVTLEGVLGYPFLEPGISGMAPVPNNNLTRANLRIYCDNDDYSISRESSARWKLKEDPENPPTDYVPQELRKKHWDPSRRPDEAFQEFEDNDNGMTASNLSCQLLNALGSSHFVIDKLATLDDIPRNAFLTELDDLANSGTLDVLTALTSAVLLVSTSLLPAWGLKIPDPPQQTFMGAWTWHDVQALRPEEKILNPYNYLYFSLLATLADRGYRLPRGTDTASMGEAFNRMTQAYNGVLVRDPTLIRPFGGKRDAVGARWFSL
ncbi:MAG: hypothetical protein Q9227_008287 [Pyrenula ochraceoflavens]